MPRYPRNYIETSFFHVMTQGINKSYIFNYPEDIDHYINLINKLKDENHVVIIAYCIMNNHAHILVKVNALENLSKFMQRLNTSYGIYYNKIYNRVGFVFRNRFKSEGIYNEHQFYNCINYIYNNPVKAGICQKADQYPYSNYKKIDKVFAEAYSFIDIDEDKYVACCNIINSFLLKNELTKQELKKDNQLLKKLLIILRGTYNFPFDEISKHLNISKSTLWRHYNK